MNKSKAFTLAEVLITLTIIGVIAALTIPNLVQKYTKHQYVVGLKKAYSTLQNAMKMIPVSEGCPAGDYECAGFFDKHNEATDIDNQSFEGNASKKALYLLSKQMKVKDFCKGTFSAKDNPCNFTSKYMSSNALYNDSMYYGVGFITQDGMLWSVRIQNGKDNADYYRNSVSVDVNGKKGPNQTGRDVFQFILANTTRNGVQQGTVLPANGALYIRYLGFGVLHNCSSANLGAGCTGKVLEEDAMNY